MSTLICNGDLSKLSPAQKLDYYAAYCTRLGLDPVTQPFRILRLNGKEVLYCDRGGAAQLNANRKVSHSIVAREVVNDCYVVTARATLLDGRHTESIGAVPIKGMSGEALCNAYMKAETKAKRRSTLDLCGLGMLDEIEIDSIPNVSTAAIDDTKHGKTITHEEFIAPMPKEATQPQRQPGEDDASEQAINSGIPANSTDAQQPQTAAATGGDERLISDAQARRMFAIMKSANKTIEEVKAIIAIYGYGHSKEIKRKDYDAICAEVQKPKA
jgi:hypothetical protein